MNERLKQAQEKMTWKTMDSVFQYIIPQPGQEKYVKGDSVMITVNAVLGNDGVTLVDTNHIDKECLRFTRIAAQTTIEFNEKKIIKRAEEGVLRADFSAVDWRKDFAVTIYLEKEIKKSEIDTLIKKVRRFPEVHRAEFISKEEVNRRWMESGDEDLLKGLEGNSLPASIEITIEPDYLKESAIKALADGIRKEFPELVFLTYYHAKMIRVIDCSRKYIFLISYKT